MAKVLVVDDSLSVRKVVEKALEGRSMQVLSAASGAEALDHIEREHPDVVVCDVVLPDNDGYQICEFVRSHPVVGRTPVLLISGVVNSTVLSRAAEVQSNDVMFKPFAADELVRKIDALLGSRNGAAHGTSAPVTAGAGSTRAASTGAGGALGGPDGVTGEPATRSSEGARPRADVSAGYAPRSPERRDGLPKVEFASPPESPSRREVTLRADGGHRTTATTPLNGDVSGDGLKGRLAWLIATSGAKFAALADREGFLIEFAGDVPLEVEVAGALASCLAESSDGIGRELQQGTLLGMILEYEKGMLLLQSVGPSALLAVVLAETAALGKARYYIKKTLPDLQRAL